MPAVEFPLFWKFLGRLVSHLIGAKAHAEVILVIQDGVIMRVRVNRTFLPGDIPRIE